MTKKLRVRSVIKKKLKNICIANNIKKVEIKLILFSINLNFINYTNRSTLIILYILLLLTYINFTTL